MGDKVKVKLHTFLTSTLDEGANLPTGRSRPLKGNWVGPRFVTDWINGLWYKCKGPSWLYAGFAISQHNWKSKGNKCYAHVSHIKAHHNLINGLWRRPYMKKRIYIIDWAQMGKNKCPEIGASSIDGPNWVGFFIRGWWPVPNNILWPCMETK
jgi:hypothetical protein